MKKKKLVLEREVVSVLGPGREEMEGGSLVTLIVASLEMCPQSLQMVRAGIKVAVGLIGTIGATIDIASYMTHCHDCPSHECAPTEVDCTAEGCATAIDCPSLDELTCLLDCAR